MLSASPSTLSSPGGQASVDNTARRLVWATRQPKAGAPKPVPAFASRLGVESQPAFLWACVSSAPSRPTEDRYSAPLRGTVTSDSAEHGDGPAQPANWRCRGTGSQKRTIRWLGTRAFDEPRPRRATMPLYEQRVDLV